VTNYAHHIKDGGYLMIDHRASPGLPEDIARKSGYDPNYCKEGHLFEAATLTCSHCKCSVVKNPLRIRERANCSKCGYHYVCDFCAAMMMSPDYNHTPFEKVIELVINGSADATTMGSPPVLILPPTFHEET
jgi:hypothetical protein